MFARYFFIFLGIISLIWIGYVATDIINKKESLSPQYIFGKEDGQILIINRKNEVDGNLIPFKTTLKNEEILGNIKRHLIDEKSIYISSNRRHFLIESQVNWTNQKVKSLLKSCRIKYESTGLRSFKISDYEIIHHKNMLYFYGDELETTNVDGWDNFDKKSSASLIDLKGETPIITEIYFRSAGKIEFSTQNVAQVKGNQVDDKKLFSEVLPKNITDYHFLEKQYTSNTDPIFKAGLMNQWMDKGWVSFKYKGVDVIISDYLTGQEPINVLNEKFQIESEETDHSFYDSIQLTTNFPQNKKSGFYIYSLNDFVIISENQSICEDIVTQNKLGKTLATDITLSNKIFSNLPSRVSERFVGADTKFSRAVYKNKILETRISVHSSESEQDNYSDLETFTINVEAPINDFISFDGKGNAVVLTETGELMNYSIGKLTWMKNLNSKPVGQITYIEQFQLILITCKNSIHLIDRNGKYVLGGPVVLDGKTPSQAASQFEWKGKLYLVYPDLNGNIIVFDSKRKLIATLPNSMPYVISPVDVWVSQKKLFIGIKDNTTFKMIDFAKRQEYRSFNIPNSSQSFVADDEIYLFASENSKLVFIDQKGVKNQINSGASGKLKSTPKGRKDNFLSYISGGQINVLGTLGSLIGKINLEFSGSEIWDIQTINGRTYVSVIDDLENNVYLYEIDGKKLNTKALEGSKKSMINSNDSALILTSIVDNYLIQYMIK